MKTCARRWFWALALGLGLVGNARAQVGTEEENPKVAPPPPSAPVSPLGLNRIAEALHPGLYGDKAAAATVIDLAIADLRQHTTVHYVSDEKRRVEIDLLGSVGIGTNQFLYAAFTARAEAQLGLGLTGWGGATFGTTQSPNITDNQVNGMTTYEAGITIPFSRKTDPQPATLSTEDLILALPANSPPKAILKQMCPRLSTTTYLGANTIREENYRTCKEFPLGVQGGDQKSWRLRVGYQHVSGGRNLKDEETVTAADGTVFSAEDGVPSKMSRPAGSLKVGTALRYHALFGGIEYRLVGTAKAHVAGVPVSNYAMLNLFFDILGAVKMDYDDFVVRGTAYDIHATPLPMTKTGFRTGFTVRLGAFACTMSGGKRPSILSGDKFFDMGFGFHI